MELRRYFDLVRRWLWLVALLTILGAALVYVISRNATPVYRASATMLINQVQNTAGTADLSALMTSERLARTYSELMISRPVLEQVIAELGLRTTPGELVRVVSVRPLRDTQLLELTAENSDPQLAADIANSIANVFIARNVEKVVGQTRNSRELLRRQISDLERQIRSTNDAIEQARRSGTDASRVNLLQSDLATAQVTYAQLLRNEQGMTIAEARSANSIELVSPAISPPLPISPRPLQNAALAAILGLLLAGAIAFLYEYVDDTIKTPEDVERATGLSILGAILRVPGVTDDDRRQRHPLAHRRGLPHAAH